MSEIGRQTIDANDEGDFTITEVKSLAQIKNVRQLSNYGYFCAPPLTSTWVLFDMRANLDDVFGIGHDYDKRMKNLQPGEIAIGNTETGAYIFLDKDGNIHIHAPQQVHVTCDTAYVVANTSITVEAPKTTWTGNITLHGTLTSDEDVIASGISLNSHVHSGVQSGGSNTGGPV